MDQGKDYEPTVNKGKHGFVADSVDMRFDWYIEGGPQWQSDIEQLSSLPNTLAGWIEADLAMFVKCGTGYLCDQSSVLTIGDLTRHAVAGLSLEGLKSRLKCTKCGKRGAHVIMF